MIFIIIGVFSCSSQSARVEREAKIRTRAEMYSTYLDEDLALIYDYENGKNHYMQNCASCHGADGKKNSQQSIPHFKSLSQSAIVNPEEFLVTMTYGKAKTKMKGFENKIPLFIMIDIIGYTMNAK